MYQVIAPRFERGTACLEVGYWAFKQH